MGIYEASHPINHSNILQCKYSLYTPPETNHPSLSGQLCLYVKMHEKELLLKGSKLEQNYWCDKKMQSISKSPRFIPSRPRLF